jgi:hypothetical protein
MSQRRSPRMPKVEIEGPAAPRGFAARWRDRGPRGRTAKFAVRAANLAGSKAEPWRDRGGPMSTMGINQAAVGAATGLTGGTSAAGTSKAAQEDSTAVTNFLNYMKESPAQRLEDAWLAAHGLTEKDLLAMSPDKRQAILKQMADDIKRQLQQATQNALKKNGAGAVAAAISG